MDSRLLLSSLLLPLSVFLTGTGCKRRIYSQYSFRCCVLSCLRMKMLVTVGQHELRQQLEKWDNTSLALNWTEIMLCIFGRVQHRHRHYVINDFVSCLVGRGEEHW